MRHHGTVTPFEQTSGAADDTALNGGAAGVQSVDRAATVLQILAREGQAGVSEIAAEMGIHKSTASRLLGALVARELVQQDRDRGKYQLGFGILRLAAAIPGRLNLVQEAGPFLRELAAGAEETANLAVLRSGYAVNVDQARGPRGWASRCPRTGAGTWARRPWPGGVTRATRQARRPPRRAADVVPCVA